MYSNSIIINKNFQTSINLDLDLNNEQKIKEYIPTTDICDVIAQYFEAFSNKTNGRATTLVGPYGKGKSFLLLVISYLVSSPASSKCYIELLRKISAINPQLAKAVKDYRNKGGRLLPVIINSNYNNLNQAFQLALNDSLTRNGLTGIVPNTAFNVCISLIEKWEADKEFNKKALIKCLEINKVSLQKLSSELKAFSPDAYIKFKNLYNCITGGLSFNPLINDDIVKIYSDVNYELNKKGYTGILIIFDEFSKFIESNNDSLMHDLKIIQDFAELSVRSSTSSQINLCCVTHKSLNLYGRKQSENLKDSFKTVEGRFKEIKFNRSLEENFQIISAAIKKVGMDRTIQSYIESHKDLYKKTSDNLGLLRPEETKALYEGCFPLNPNTVLALIELSELVAQNERTLFTFLSDVDENGFNAFIHQHNEGLMNTDKLYDYFSPLLKKEETNRIREIWYRAESTLSKTIDELERRIIKTLAILLMVNDQDHFVPKTSILACNLNEQEARVTQKVEDLINKHFIRRNPINNLLAFASSNSKEIDDKISIIKQTKLKSFDLSVFCNEINENRFLLPRRHNQQNKITRFFKIIYLSDTQFDRLKGFEILKNEAKSDGLAIRLLSNSLTIQQVQKKLDSIKDKRVIVSIPSKQIESYFAQEVQRAAALKELKSEIKGDQLVEKEIDLLLEEANAGITTMLDEYFSEDCPFASYGFKCEKFIEAINKSMDLCYPKRLIFNNELVNKKLLSAQYQKVVNHVIDWILAGQKNFPYSATSPENSTYVAVIKQIDLQQEIRLVVDGIKNEIKSAPENKISISQICFKYINPDGEFGIRLGVFPLLFAQAIYEISSKDNAVLYFKDKEIDLNSENLVKAISTDSNYYISFSKGSKDQAEYLAKMLKLFELKSSNVFRTDIKLLTEELRRFFVGLPSIIRSVQETNNYLELPHTILNYKSYFYSYNLNPFELVFEDLYKSFETRSLNQIYDALKAFKQNYQNYVSSFKKLLISKIKQELDIDRQTSLKMGLTPLLQQITGGKAPLLDDQSKRIYETITNNLSYDDMDCINQISFAAIDRYIEDWDTDNTSQVLQKLLSFFQCLKETKKVSTKDFEALSNLSSETTPMGQLLENNLAEILEEYGESVTNEEKLAILAKMIKGIM